jgi:hypothetical protein
MAGTTGVGGSAVAGTTSTGGRGGGASGGSSGGSGGQPQAGSGGTGLTGGTASGGRGGFGKGGTTSAGTGGTISAGTGGSGTAGTGTAGSAGSPPVELDCDTPMPTGGQEHCGQNTRGMAGGQNWELWCNTLSSSACMTTFDTTAFSARWNNNGDFLARVGLEFGNNGRPYEEYGTLKADFSFIKSGSGGGFSYIGIYGWTNNPCVERYIVADRYGSMPFDAYNASSKRMVMIDGENYELFQNRTTGTGGSRCSGVSQWDQFWSIRQSGRQCGTITISEHFRAWEAAGLAMGGLLEAKILVETGGAQGSIDFPVARVIAE